MDCCGSGLIHSLHREYMHDNVESIDEEINGYQEAMKSYAIAMESNGERLSIRRLDWIPSPRKIILTLWTKSETFLRNLIILIHREKVSELVYGEKSPKKSLRISLRRKVTEKKSPKKSLRFSLRRKVTEKKPPIWFTEKSHREKVSDFVYGEKSPKKSLRFSLRRKVTEKKSPIWFTEKSHRIKSPI
ncbi:hypothetical protein SSS_05508 [Sarcoptes scabiei]|uniref:Uncharacterized protein n=1 Tax=Sarcoptes scabiei TaxID=52283 RepID=A0A834R949_SARSC|nr:hypothetical protein SSS_05508 [Sarcoptes scabiei]